MSHTFVEGTRVPTTAVLVGPCVVTQIKTLEKDGYWAVQLGFGAKRIKNVTKPLLGHLSGVIKDKKAPLFLREIRLSEASDFKVGDEIKLKDVFKKGDLVTVTGISKGKGFAGVVKRWGFAGGPKTHGQSDRQRAPGSIGQGTTPGRVLKGKKMGGRMGQDTVTVKNLIVVDIKPDEGVLYLSGPIPGSTGSLVSLTKTASGKLEELVEEVPQVQIQEGEEGGEASESGTQEGQSETSPETKEESQNES